MPYRQLERPWIRRPIEKNEKAYIIMIGEHRICALKLGGIGEKMSADISTTGRAFRKVDGGTWRAFLESCNVVGSNYYL